MEKIAAQAASHISKKQAGESPEAHSYLVNGTDLDGSGIIALPETSLVLIKDQPYLAFFCN